MEFDFDRLIDRRASGSDKWEAYAEDVLPLWVADMDFAVAPAIAAALRKRTEHPIFGYESQAGDRLRELIVARLRHRYGWSVSAESLVFLPGVVPAFTLCARTFVEAGQSLFYQSPVYPPIVEVGQTQGLETRSMELNRTEDGRYGIDPQRFTAALDPSTALFILCNPHNPVGRVFSADELEMMAAECIRRDVVICSDEIHCDIVYDGRRHIPIASISPEIEARTITLMAPSKTFNVAGLQCSFAVIPNRELRRKFKHAVHYLFNPPNLMGYIAAEAAYEYGDEWLQDLLVYLEANRNFVYDYVAANLPGIETVKPEGTFLAWLDCRNAALPQDPYRFFLEKARVALLDGKRFGAGGNGFVRLNFAAPRSLIEEGLERMRRAL